jgi:hypothetical protein
VWKYVDQFRFAYAAHAIDITPRDPNDLQGRIERALAMEDNPNWRSRLRRAVGAYREEVLEEWEAKRVSTTQAG